VSPAEIDEEKTEETRRIAKQIFRAVDGSGLARVDFFVDRKTGKVLFNELNTMPGFTPISMYPMLWEAAGMSNKELMDRFIELALTRDTGIRG
ncbi:MAG: ATP-grasp domain-containing protein, partial [Anaerotignum sp.]|nr:ATP-grasp domain-containing protein [Anaerotignum sp.]